MTWSILPDTVTAVPARDTPELVAAPTAEALAALPADLTAEVFPIDPDLDPTTAAWNSTPRYSTEHLWPENRGATEGTPAHSDMHHLAPVMQSVNSSRSDHPFGEVVDAEADRWWGPDGVTGTAMPPASVRDLYTEKLNASTASLLEPRESVKGDVARAMFYVWAVYGPSGADQGRPWPAIGVAGGPGQEQRRLQVGGGSTARNYSLYDTH